MVDTMNHIERCVAAFTDKPGRQAFSIPVGHGSGPTLRGRRQDDLPRVGTDPKKFAQGFIAGQKYFDHDWAIGLMDLSVMAGDLGAHVRMDEQNTPFVDKTVITTPRTTRSCRSRTSRRAAATSWSRAPACSSRRWARRSSPPRSWKDRCWCSPSPPAPSACSWTWCTTRAPCTTPWTSSPSTTRRWSRHSPGSTEARRPVWDYLWANYSCLGDKEYEEFEGNAKYADKLNELVADKGMANCIHNCADLPHLDTQVKALKPAIFSMAYYPLIPEARAPRRSSARDTRTTA